MVKKNSKRCLILGDDKVHFFFLISFPEKFFLSNYLQNLLKISRMRKIALTEKEKKSYLIFSRYFAVLPGKFLELKFSPYCDSSEGLLSRSITINSFKVFELRRSV